jgi:DNA/RNA endonuclease YhcR with UshA esterase domain
LYIILYSQYMKKILLASTLLLSIAAGFESCVKKDFDTPPDTSNYDPNLEVTHTILQMQDQFLPGNMIDTDAVISGIVVMDDRSGNYYKKIVIQDSTGGIEILIDQNNLYNDYPVGRKVYVKLKGLYISEYGQNKQLGYTPDASGSLSNIPFVEADKYIIKASYPHPVVADTFTIAELKDVNNMTHRLNTLIAIKDVEFADVDVEYAQLASLASATNRTIKDCNGGSILLRSSGYAKFQPEKTPGGRGVLVGVYTRYRNDAQIYIRDTKDVAFTDSVRCDGTVYKQPDLISIDSLVKLYEGSSITLPPIKVRGVVISDVLNKNISGGNVILQGTDGTRGITLYYGGSPTYNLGDSLEVILSGGSLDEYRGKLQVSNISTSKTTRLASNVKVTPKVVTIDQIASNTRLYESTLVQINNINWQAGYTTINGNAGNLNVSDATGTILHYTANGATFKDYVLPTSPVNAIVGYVDIFSGTLQLRIRNTTDIKP